MKYHFTGCQWGNTKSFREWDKECKFPCFDKVAERKFVTEANSLDEACVRFITKFPEWAIGFNAVSDDRKDFYMGAVKDYFFQMGDNPTDVEIVANIRKGFEKRCA